MADMAYIFNAQTSAATFERMTDDELQNAYTTYLTALRGPENNKPDWYRASLTFPPDKIYILLNKEILTRPHHPSFPEVKYKDDNPTGYYGRIGGGKQYITFKGHRYVVRSEGKSKFIQTTKFGRLTLSDVKHKNKQ